MFCRARDGSIVAGASWLLRSSFRIGVRSVMAVPEEGGWTGDRDVREILKVKCWKQGKFVYLWAERVNPIRRVECSRGGGGGGGGGDILDSSLVSSLLRLRFRRIFPLILARYDC
jgi:hypothetical protein